MTQLNFDARQIAPDIGFDTVPKGWYIVMMDESEMKATKAGGAMLKCRFVIADGQFKGRKLFTQINLRHDNPIVVEIGQKKLSAIAHAVGVLLVQDSQQLHNIPLKVRVKIRKDDSGQYDDQNEITAYKNINEQVELAGSGPAAGGAPFVPPAQQAPPAQSQWAPPANAAPPVQQQTPVQQWAPPAQQQAPQAQPQSSWQPPAGGQQQPWQQPPAAQQAPAQQAPGAPPAGAPAAAGAPFNASTAIPPWQK